MNEKRLKEYWLSLVAFGPRPTGSQNAEQAGRALLSELQKIVPSAHFQEYSFTGWQYGGRHSLWVMSGEAREIPCCPMLGSASTGETPAEGVLTDLGIQIVWGMYNWKRYGILNGGQLTGYLSVRPDYGAIPQLLAEGNSDLPHFVIDTEQDALIAREMQQGEVRVRLEATAETGLYTGRNIVARLDGPQKPRLILTAHYDTVFNSIGAYDNASGVAVLLELANLLKNKHRNLPVEIVLTDSEEWNLMGSRAHAASLSKDDVELAFNVDGIGRGSVLELWSSGEAYERRLFQAMRRICPNEQIVFKWPAPPGSDHQAYSEKGIPAQMLTFNDLEILHTPRDLCSEAMLRNMVHTVSILEALFAAYGFCE